MTRARLEVTDLAAGPEPSAVLERRVRAVCRTWTPCQRTHAGDVAWSAAAPALGPRRL